MIKVNEYGCVINCKETFVGVAMKLYEGNSVFISWEDDSGHFDIFLKWKADSYNGKYQRGMKWNDIFIGIVGYGFYGFELRESKTSDSYYTEKFGHYLGVGMYEFINGVRKELHRLVREDF